MRGLATLSGLSVSDAKLRGLPLHDGLVPSSALVQVLLLNPIHLLCDFNIVLLLPLLLLLVLDERPVLLHVLPDLVGLAHQLGLLL